MRSKGRRSSKELPTHPTQEVPLALRQELERTGGLEKVKNSLPSEDDMDVWSHRMQALGDPLRLKVMHILENKPLCVCLIKELCQAPDSKLSYHLSVLKDASLIEGEQDGNWIIYRATPVAKRLLKVMDKDEGGR
ncbi:MAG: metalloregulator ArsR/SmtB family transcription factor [Methanomassiliicoccales archaeon]|nr:metalloregulator ArsR/SmtB family transcription factor [Methanomassiliicoccales archaeon]